VVYAKSDPESIRLRITAHNRGPEAAKLHLLPTLWFRNTWSWGEESKKPKLFLADASSEAAWTVWAEHPELGVYHLSGATPAERGLPDWDNHLCAGEVRLELIPGQWTGLVFSMQQEVSPDLQKALERFRGNDLRAIELAESRSPESATGVFTRSL